MRANLAFALLLLIPFGLLSGADDQDFSGNWTLDLQKSNLRDLQSNPSPVLAISQQGPAFHCTESGVTWSFQVDGAESNYKIKDSSLSTQAKWERSVLLVNTLVSGPQNYIIEDRWQMSKDHAILTIDRTIRRGTSEIEATLVYRDAGRLTAPPPGQIVVKAGTKIPLSLVNSLNTKYSAEGDRVYLETAFPVIEDGRIIIPKGSYVAGTVTEVKRPTRAKGKAELYVRFDSLTLPNGVTRDFRSRLDNADGQDVERQEGTIRAETDKAGDAKKVGEVAGAGASVGGIAARSVTGVGVGALTGAAIGLAAVLFTPGPDVVVPKGSTLEMLLDRDLRYEPRELEIR